MANVKLSDGLRERLGSVLSGYVSAGENENAGFLSWVETCRSFHRNDPVGYAGTRDDPGYEIFHLPLSQPRQDALVAQVVNVVATQDPAMLDVDDEQGIADAKQRFLQRLWADAEFAARCEAAARECTDSDVAYWRVCPLGDGRVEFAVVPPEDMIVFPALRSGLMDATAVGHRVKKRRRDVREGQDEGRYYGDGDTGLARSSDDGQTRGINSSSGPLENLDAPVELWDLCVWLNLKSFRQNDEMEYADGARWYRATVCKDSTELLALEEYDLSRPWYFRSRMVGSLDFHPTTSVAKNLLPVQRAWNNLHSATYAGLMAGFAAPIYGPPLNNGEKTTKYGWMEYIETDSPVQPWSPGFRAPVNVSPVILQGYERIADEISGISQNTTGGDSPSQTATEASIVASGVASKLEQYIRNFTQEFPDMAAFTMELVASDPEPYKARLNVQPPPPPMPPAMPPMALPMPQAPL